MAELYINVVYKKKTIALRISYVITIGAKIPD